MEILIMFLIGLLVVFAYDDYLHRRWWRLTHERRGIVEVYIAEQAYAGYEAIFSTLDKAIEFAKNEEYISYGTYRIYKERIDEHRKIPELVACVEDGVVELEKENDEWM